MDFDYPFLTELDDHLDSIDYLQEALAIASIMEQVDQNKLKKIADMSHHPSGFYPFNTLMGIIRQKIIYALERLHDSKPADDPGLLFEHIFNQMKFPPIGEKKVTYIGEVFGRLINKMQIDQGEDIREPKKEATA